MRFFVGISGASGVRLGYRLVEELCRIGEVHFAITTQGKWIADTEGDIPPLPSHVRGWGINDLSAPPGSGSFRLNGVVVIPCSMGTLGRIAQGISSNLIERVADVGLKERRPLILITRETPLNAIHLENMLKVQRSGGTILPPVLTYYHKPKSIKDMEDFILGKIMDSLGIEHSLFKRWVENEDK